MSKETNPTGRVMIRNARLAFPHLFEPQPSMDGQGKPRYNCTLIIDDEKTIAKVNAAMEEAAREKWKGKAETILNTLIKKDRVCMRDGDDKARYDGFEGNMYISASSQTRPTLVDKDKSQLDASDGRIYAGCYVNASIEIWAQDNNFGQRVNAQLRGVQFARDGDAFSAGRPADADEFDDLSEGSDEDLF